MLKNVFLGVKKDLWITSSKLNSILSNGKSYSSTALKFPQLAICSLSILVIKNKRIFYLIKFQMLLLKSSRNPMIAVANSELGICSTISGEMERAQANLKIILSPMAM